MKETIDLFLAYKFLKNLVVPFEQWPAYKLGIIDKDGAVLIPRRERLDSDQKAAFGYFDIITLNLKKLLHKLPGGKSTIASYAAAYLLLKEYPKKKTQVKEDFEWTDQDTEQLEQQLAECMEEVEQHFIAESTMPVNNAGGGAIAGIGVGADGEPGFTPRAMNKYKRGNRQDINKMIRRLRNDYRPA